MVIIVAAAAAVLYSRRSVSLAPRCRRGGVREDDAPRRGASLLNAWRLSAIGQHARLGLWIPRERARTV